MAMWGVMKKRGRLLAGDDGRRCRDLGEGDCWAGGLGGEVMV